MAAENRLEPASDWPLAWDVKSLLFALAGGVLFGILAYVSIELTRGSGRIAAVWLPNALAIALLLRARLSNESLLLACLFLGNLVADLAVGDPLPRAIGLSAANSAEILTAVLLMRRFAGARPDMRDIHHLAAFVVFAAICAPLVSASIAWLTLSLLGTVEVGMWLRWLAADGLGILIVTPAVLILADALSAPRRPSRSEVIDWLVVPLMGTGLTLFIFAQSQYPLLFLIAPVMLAHAFRLGSLGTTFALVMVAVIATFFSWIGSGPIMLGETTLTERLLTLQLFLAVAFFIGQPVAAILHTRASLMREIAAHRADLDTLAHCITDAVLRFDAAGICTYASPSVEAVLGYPPGFYVGRPASMKTHPEAKAKIADVERRLVSGESLQERFTYRRIEDDEEGRAVYIEADCACTFDRATGERNGFIVSSRDVTERVRLQSDLIRARRRAEHAARAKSTFLANMSHEIRTPMNGVLGFTELLLQSDLDDNQRRKAELIHDSGRSMMLLLNDILDLSKIEAGQVVINRQPFDIHRLLHDCTQLHAAYAERKGIDLVYRDGSILHRHIVSDPLRLRQIVLNLVGNALKFTEKGEVRVSLEAMPRSLAIHVEDTGIGIPKARMATIFEPFRQADGKTSRRYGGTGLGLTISRQLAELLGGSLTCESTPGKGSRFTLELPLELADHAPQAAPVEGQDASADENRALQPARILLADDHDINRVMAVEMLQRCGQEVTVAANGLEAVAKIRHARAAGRPFDLVLMDIQMPGCDGYSASRRIRKCGITPEQLPIIALTANAFPEDIENARQAGMQDHVAKPLALDALLAALQRWLPARIVEDDGQPAPTGIGGPGMQDEGGEPAPVAAEKASGLHHRWRARRSETITAIAEALRQDRLDTEATDELARMAHKLAGTAGSFGEVELGLKAGAFERALRSGQPTEVARKLADELLETAAAGENAADAA